MAYLKGFTDKPQAMLDLGINYFAVELLAESFAIHREQWGEDAICVIGYGKDKKLVYITLSSDFPPAPKVDPEKAKPLEDR